MPNACESSGRSRRSAIAVPRIVCHARYRLLAIDIDGTLVNSRNELTDATRDAVLRARQAGIEIVLATGRRYSRVLPLVEPLELNVPLVTASGALIKRAADHRTLLSGRVRCRARSSAAWQVVAAAGYEAVLYADTFDQGFDYYCAHAATQLGRAGRVLANETRAASGSGPS